MYDDMIIFPPWLEGVNIVAKESGMCVVKIKSLKI